MMCSILQPHYLPWVGYFSMIKSVDVFIFFDDVQFIKREWKNRNKIRKTNVSSDFTWLSVPIKKDSQRKNINICEIDYSDDWQSEHLNKIRNVYANTPHFLEIYDLIEKNLKKKHKFLSDLNINLIKIIMDYLEIKTKLQKSSDLNVEGKKDFKMLNISKKINAKKIFINQLTESYLNREIFEERNINVIVQKFNENKYTQYNKKIPLEWIPKLSIIDILFNCGKNTEEFL